jgi:hypothetical protein
MSPELELPVVRRGRCEGSYGGRGCDIDCYSGCPDGFGRVFVNARTRSNCLRVSFPIGFGLSASDAVKQVQFRL